MFSLLGLLMPDLVGVQDVMFARISLCQALSDAFCKADQSSSSGCGTVLVANTTIPLVGIELLNVISVSIGF